MKTGEVSCMERHPSNWKRGLMAPQLEVVHGEKAQPGKEGTLVVRFPSALTTDLEYRNVYAPLVDNHAVRTADADGRMIVVSLSSGVIVEWTPYVNSETNAS